MSADYYQVLGLKKGASEEEIKKYFEEHPEEFHQAEMRRARHILVASEEEAKAIENSVTGGKAGAGAGASSSSAA